MPGYVRARKDANGRIKKRADGSTIWQARWRPADDPGDTRREEKNFKTKRDAQNWIRKRDTDVERGAYAPASRGAVLFSSVADELRAVWIAKGLEPKTRAGYEAILDHWLIGEADPLHPGRPARFRSVRIGAITTKMAQDFIGEIAKQRAPNTARRIFGVLSDVMKLAAQRGYMATSPCAAVELPSKKRAGVRRSHLYLEGPELLGLADAIPAHWRVPVLVAGSCGLRAGELWALRRRDVDLLHKDLTVRYALKEINSSAASLAEDKGLIVGPPKSAASRRRVSIPTELLPLLRSHIEAPGARAPGGYTVARAVDEDHADLGYTRDATDPDRLLFVTPRGYPVRHNLFYKRVFRPAIEGRPASSAKPAQRGRAATPARPAVPAALPARLQAFRWHDLRHTCAALSLASPGANLATVKERLGHENIATTVDLYGKRVPSVDAAIADAVGASIWASPRRSARPAGEGTTSVGRRP